MLRASFGWFDVCCVSGTLTQNIHAGKSAAGAKDIVTAKRHTTGALAVAVASRGKDQPIPMTNRAWHALSYTKCQYRSSRPQYRLWYRYRHRIISALHDTL